MEENKKLKKEEKKKAKQEKLDNMEPEARARHKKIKGIMSIVLLVVVFVGCGVGYYYYSQGTNYFVTDNAKVTAKMYSVMPIKAGELKEWTVSLGDVVKKDQVLGRQDILPYITAPIDGVVVKNDGNVGQTVAPTNPVAIVADTNNMYIGVNIEETDIIKIKLGQSVDVTVDAYGNKDFKGTITEVAQATQTYFAGVSSFSTSGTYSKVTQLIPVRVDIENPENLPLTFGMNATVKIHINEKGNLQASEGDKPKTIENDTYQTSIEAKTQMKVTPNIAGKVMSVNVTEGQNVKEGDVLFTLDQTDLSLQVRQAQAAYNTASVAYNNSQTSYSSQSNIIPAQVALDDAKVAYEQAKTLFAAGGTSQNALDNAKSRVETAEAQLKTASTASKGGADSARAQLASAKAALDLAVERKNNGVVKAPMTGQVLSCSIVAGDVVSQQMPPIVLYDPLAVVLKIRVPETDIAKIVVGNTAQITLQATGDTFTGKIAKIAPQVDASTGTFTVEVEASNDSGKLRVGMSADVKLTK